MTEKSVGDASRDLEAAVRKHSFGVLHVFDLKDTLTKKGYPLEPQCKIFEICNPQQATRVLQRDMRLNMALPCRVSVFEDKGTTKIGMILPAEMLRALSHDRELGEVAETVEAALKAIIDEAACPHGSAQRAAAAARQHLPKRSTPAQQSAPRSEAATSPTRASLPPTLSTATSPSPKSTAMRPKSQPSTPHSSAWTSVRTAGAPTAARSSHPTG